MSSAPATLRPPCSSHSHVAAVATCEGCAAFLCADCVGEAPRCSRCRGAGHPIPWEDPTLSTPAAFWRTLKALVKPGELHAKMPWTGGLRAPLTFAALAATIGALGAAGFAALSALVGGGGADALKDALLGMTPDREAQRLIAVGLEALKQLQVAQLRIALGLALLTPLLAPLELLIMGALTHGVARLLGGKGTFEATVRAQGYAAGAQVLRVVPVAGATLSALAVVLLTASGLRRAHGVSTPRAVVLALWWLPIALLFVLAFSAVTLAVIWRELAR